jgi:hypothetical protein
MPKQRIDVTWLTALARKATAVVKEVTNIAEPARAIVHATRS